MDQEKLRTTLQIGETIAVEFKKCSNRIENDVYQSVCSFLNRFGGDIYLGVEDDGTVCGVPENAAGDMVKNFIKIISNPNMFTPTIYLSPEIIKYEGKTIIHIHIPVSAEVHSFKKEVYDRVDDADVKVTATAQLAMMYIRKQNRFTEKQIYPYISLEDFRLDLLPRIRKMATSNIEGLHSWESMSDEELLRSAGLYGKDRATGESGYNLAAVMLLGKDDLIMDICPAYETDALVRRVNVDRYDDREIIRTNLIESYDQLMEFGRKHLPDKFFIEGVERKNLRNIITREMIANTLIHREFTSSYTAKFVIEKDRMYTENANRSSGDGIITPDNMEPNPKNPIIASFFRNIGWSDRLGSGVRNIFKYSKYYSGEEPEFVEGDVFRIIVPSNEDYSYDNPQNDSIDELERKNEEKLEKNQKRFGESSEKVRRKFGEKSEKDQIEIKNGRITDIQKQILEILSEDNQCSARKIAEQIGVSSRSIESNIKKLKGYGMLTRHGSARSGYWKVEIYRELP